MIRAGGRVLARTRSFASARSGVYATIQTLLTNVLILGVNVGTGVITARLLGPDGRGAQAAMVLWPQFLAYALTLGLPSSMLYNLKQFPEKASRLFSASLLIGTPLGILATLVGVVFIPRWITEYPTEVVVFAQWLMLTAPVWLLALVFTYILQAREEFGLYNISRYAQPLITLVALVLLAVFYRLTPLNAAMAYVLAIVPIFLWMLVRLWKIYRPSLWDLRPVLGNLTSYGLRSYGVNLFGPIVAGQLDRVLVVGLLQPSLMGLYVVALSLSRILTALQNAVASVFFSKASGRSTDEVITLVGRAVRVSTTGTLLVALGLGLLGPFVMGLVYGPDFLGAVLVFRILLLEAVLGGATWVLAHAFMALDRPGTVSVMQGVGVGLSVPLLLLLIPRYGLAGAGTALLIATAVRLAGVLISFPLILKKPLPKLWPRLADFTTLLVSSPAPSAAESSAEPPAGPLAKDPEENP